MLIQLGTDEHSPLRWTEGARFRSIELGSTRLKIETDTRSLSVVIRPVESLRKFAADGAHPMLLSNRRFQTGPVSKDIFYSSIGFEYSTL